MKPSVTQNKVSSTNRWHWRQIQTEEDKPLNKISIWSCRGLPSFQCLAVHLRWAFFARLTCITHGQGQSLLPSLHETQKETRRRKPLGSCQISAIVSTVLLWINLDCLVCTSFAWKREDGMSIFLIKSFKWKTKWDGQRRLLVIWKWN